MSGNLSRARFGVAVVLGVLAMSVWSVPAGSHRLPGSTATVVLRDGLVTVNANLDIQRWIRAQKSADLAVMVATAKEQAAKLTVTIDGKPMAMTVVQFPTADTVHEILQRPVRKGHGSHPKVVQVQWQAVRAVPRVGAVSVGFPKAVGQVLVSFVEPRSRLVAAGGRAVFKSRAVVDK